MKPTTPSREDWEIDLIKFYNATPDYRTVQEFETFIRNLLQNRDNSLVAEIEKLKEPVSMDYDHSRDTWFHGHADGFNQALDKVIRIIQEK